MKCFILTNKGIEDISAKELAGFSVKSQKSVECAVFFDSSLKTLQEIAYHTQSISRACVFLAKGRLEELETGIKKASFGIKDGETVCCRVLYRESSLRLDEAEIGSWIIETINAQHGFTPKANLSKPDHLYIVFAIGENYYFGEDIAQTDLSIREYKIYAGSYDLKASIAFALLQLSGFDCKKSLLDPFCGPGIIAIEAALSCAHRSPQFFSKQNFSFPCVDKLIVAKVSITASDPMLRSIKAGQKNAKIAAVDPLINFRRIDLDYLDTKLGEGGVDCVATRFPAITKATEKKLKKDFNELFYQLEYILSKKGTAAILFNRLAYDIPPKFKVTHKRTVWQGKESFEVVVVRKDLHSDK